MKHLFVGCEVSLPASLYCLLSTCSDIHEDWLETVIPHEGSCIMIVGGRWRGSLAMLEMKERKKERVVARLLHSEEIVKISYDDVCHWVGSTDIDDY